MTPLYPPPTAPWPPPRHRKRNPRLFVVVAHRFTCYRGKSGRARPRLLRAKLRTSVAGWGVLQGWLFRLDLAGWDCHWSEV